MTNRDDNFLVLAREMDDLDQLCRFLVMCSRRSMCRIPLMIAMTSRLSRLIQGETVHKNAAMCRYML